MVGFIKESTVGEIIGDSFRIYARNIWPLFLVCLIPSAPFDLMTAAGNAGGAMPLVIVGNLGSLAASAFVYGAVTVAVSDICLGNPPSVKRSYAALGRVLGRYLGTYGLTMLIFLLGLVLLVVPGLVASVLLMFTLPVAVIERKRPVAAVKRSMALGKEFYWRNFGVLILALLVATAFGFLLFGIAAIAGLVIGTDPQGFLFNLLFVLAGVLATPLLQIPLVLLYYDMRVRKEYFDGAALSQEMFA